MEKEAIVRNRERWGLREQNSAESYKRKEGKQRKKGTRDGVPMPLGPEADRELRAKGPGGLGRAVAAVRPKLQFSC